MKNETPRQLIRTPEIRSLFAGEPFTEPALEINDLIARRAYELFESSGFTHGHALVPCASPASGKSYQIKRKERPSIPNGAPNTSSEWWGCHLKLTQIE